MTGGYRHKAFPVSWVATGRTLLLVGGCGGELCRLKHAVRFDWKRILAYHPGDESPPFCEACLKDPRMDARRGLPDRAAVAEVDLAIESTEDPAIAESLHRLCAERRIPVSTMDKPELCDFFYPALVFRGILLLAIQSSGDAPALSSRLRRWLERELGPGWAEAADALSELRRKLPRGRIRTEVLKALANDENLITLITENRPETIRQWIDHEAHRLRTEFSESA